VQTGAARQTQIEKPYYGFALRYLTNLWTPGTMGKEKPGEDNLLLEILQAREG